MFQIYSLYIHVIILSVILGMPIDSLKDHRIIDWLRLGKGRIHMDGKKRSIHLSIVKKTSISPAAFVEIINYKIEGTYNEYLMCRICKLYIFKSSI